MPPKVLDTLTISDRHHDRADDLVGRQRVDRTRTDSQPLLLTADEAATLLRTTRRAIYAMVERRQLPGIIRIRRRVLFRAAELLDWLDQKCAPPPKE